MLTLSRWCWTSSATTRQQFNWGSRSGTRTSSSSRQVYCHCLLHDDNKQLAKTTTVFFFVSMKASSSARADYQCNHSTSSLYRKYKCSPSSSPLVVEGGVNSNDAIVELLLLINACKLASAESITVSSINL